VFGIHLCIDAVGLHSRATEPLVCGRVGGQGASGGGDAQTEVIRSEQRPESKVQLEACKCSTVGPCVECEPQGMATVTVMGERKRSRTSCTSEKVCFSSWGAARELCGSDASRPSLCHWSPLTAPTKAKGILAAGLPGVYCTDCSDCSKLPRLGEGAPGDGTGAPCSDPTRRQRPEK
jgi:hypothetical protein